MCPSLIQIGSKTAEKNSAQTNRQTNRQTNTTKIMVTWPWTKNHSLASSFLELPPDCWRKGTSNSFYAGSLTTVPFITTMPISEITKKCALLCITHNMHTAIMWTKNKTFYDSIKSTLWRMWCRYHVITITMCITVPSNYACDKSTVKNKLKY